MSFDKETAKDTFFETFLEGLKNTAATGGQSLLENVDTSDAIEMVGGVILETGAGLIPILGNAYRSYNANKKIKNLNIFLTEMRNRVDSLEEKMQNSSKEDKDTYSDLLSFAIESLESYSQTEKIEFLVNGLENIIGVEKVSFDIGYLYINTLNNLTLLDISVIKLYNNRSAYFRGEDEEVEFATYEDILIKFSIEYYQYEAVRDNLYKLGLIQKKNELNVKKDFKNIKENLERIDDNVNSMHKELVDIFNPRKNKNKFSKLKTGRIKFETDDRYVLSKFGKDFFKYFIESKDLD